jgi:hypothetical protein
MEGGSRLARTRGEGGHSQTDSTAAAAVICDQQTLSGSQSSSCHMAMLCRYSCRGGAGQDCTRATQASYADGALAASRCFCETHVRTRTSSSASICDIFKASAIDQSHALQC